MKTNVIRNKVSVWAAASLAAFLCIALPATAADDMNTLYQQGRAAFYRGDFATAHKLLSQVAAANPRHTETANMLAYINANHKLVDASLEKQYAAVVLPKVEFADVTLGEAMEGLRIIAKNASNGKVTPNVIIRGEEVAQRKLSLSLSNVPLTEVLNYTTQLTNTRLTYEKHAIILSSLASVGSSSTAEASTAGKGDKK